MDNVQMTPGIDRKRTAGYFRKISDVVAFLCSTFLCVNSYAQQSNIGMNYCLKDGADSTGVFIAEPTGSPGTTMKSDLAEQRDAFDILKMLFNMDISSSDTVRKEKGKLYMAAMPAAGYSLSTQFAVTIGANAGIYTDDIDSVNLSTFNFNPTYTLRNQILLPFQSNVWTSGNSYNILGDWIYYKYPELTYGLGGHSSENAAEQLDYRYVLIRETVMKRISTDVYAGVGYDLDDHWDITDGGLPGGGVSDFQRYGENSEINLLRVYPQCDVRRQAKPDQSTQRILRVYYISQ